MEASRHGHGTGSGGNMDMDDTSAELHRVAESPFGVADLGDPRIPAVLFVVLGAAGVALLAPLLAAFPGTAADYLAATGSTASAWAQLVGGLALAGAGVAFSVAVTRLTRIAQSVAGGDYGAVARAAATAYAALVGVAAAALATDALARVIGGPASLGPTSGGSGGPAGAALDPAALPRLGYALLIVPGVVAAAVAVFGTTFSAWRAGRLGTVLALVGFLVSVLLLGGVFVYPVALLPLWLLAASFTIRRR
jgi:hypothetical protein